MADRRQTLEEPRRAFAGAPVPRALNGNVIVSELIRNMEIGRFEMAYSVLLPCVFTIYLNPEDHVALSGVFDLIIEDARKALRARVAEWNSSSFGPGKRKRGASKEYKIACREWALDFLPEPDVPSGDVEIHSQLNEILPAGFRGTRTTLLGREPAVTRPLPDAGAQTVYAAVHYEDDGGPQTYLIKHNRVRIGRGGDGQAVDLALRVTDEISRNHLTIRRDPATGIFSALDTSTNGTWVNGKRLVKGAEGVLPARAEIVLGEVLTLLFEARG